MARAVVTVLSFLFVGLLVFLTVVVVLVFGALGSLTERRR